WRPYGSVNGHVRSIQRVLCYVNHGHWLTGPRVASRPHLPVLASQTTRHKGRITLSCGLRPRCPPRIQRPRIHRRHTRTVNNRWFVLEVQQSAKFEYPCPENQPRLPPIWPIPIFLFSTGTRVEQVVDVEHPLQTGRRTQQS